MKRRLAASMEAVHPDPGLGGVSDRAVEAAPGMVRTLESNQVPLHAARGLVLAESVTAGRAST